MSIQLHFVGLYPIDLSQKSTQRVEISDREAAIIAYTEDLINTLLDNQTNRLFKFRDMYDECQVASKLAVGGERP
jgi:hypothetical protein